jgi:hypothetical protein
MQHLGTFGAEVKRTPLWTTVRRASTLSLSDLASAFEDIGGGGAQPALAFVGGTSSTGEGQQRVPPQQSASPLSLSLTSKTNRKQSLVAGRVVSEPTLRQDARDIQQIYESLLAMSNQQLADELTFIANKKHFSKAIIGLYVLERRVRPGSGLDEHEIPIHLIRAVLKIVGCFGISQIQGSHISDMLGENAVGGHDENWVQILVEACVWNISQQCHSFSFGLNVQLVHLLTQCEDAHYELLLSTLADNMMVQMSTRTGCIVTGQDETSSPPDHDNDDVHSRTSNTLASAILLSQSVSHECRLHLPLVQNGGTRPHQGSEGILARYEEHEAARLSHILASAHHPIANERFMSATLQFIGSLFSEFRALGREPVLSPQSWFFLLRSLAKSPWLPQGATLSLLPSLRLVLESSPNICRGLLMFLGRDQVRVADIPLVLKVLEIQTQDLNRSIRERKSANSPHQRRLRFIELNKLPSYLPLVHHVVTTTLGSLVHQRRDGDGSVESGDSSPTARRDQLRAVQSAAKQFYQVLCDDLLESLQSLLELCHAKLVDQVLHHLVCQAPRAVIHHPLVLHLVFAMSQTLPSLRFLSEGTQTRLLAVVERLQEAQILNEMCQLPFSMMRQHPLILSALEDTLEHKRQSLMLRIKNDPTLKQSTMHRRGGAPASDDVVLPSYKDHPNLLESNSSIAFVSLRKLVLRYQN